MTLNTFASTRSTLMQTKGCYDMSSDPFSQKFPGDAVRGKASATQGKHSRDFLVYVYIQSVHYRLAFTATVEYFETKYKYTQILSTNAAKH